MKLLQIKTNLDNIFSNYHKILMLEGGFNLEKSLRQTSSKKFLGGWLIVVGCMLIQAIPFSIAANIQPHFMDYVVKGKGFSLSGFSLVFTLGTIAAAIASPIIGQLYSKFNAKIIFIIGAILSGGGFFLFGFADKLWQFYLVAAITQVGTAAISSIGVPLLINAWFSSELKGKAMGLAFAGGSIGNIFLQQLVVRSLTNYGYTDSYFIFGIFSLIVGIPVALLILRMPKSDKDMIKSKAENKKEEVKEKIDISYSFAEVKTVKYFWFYCIGFIFLGVYVSAVSVQYPAYLKGALEIAPSTVGLVGSLIAVFALVGNLLGGVLFDKLGITKCVMAAFVFSALACISLMITGEAQKFAFIFAIFVGLSVFSYIMGPAYITGAHFGKKNYGAILGIINLMFAIGFSLGSSIFGLIIDKIGYGFGWSAVLVMIIISYTLVIIASIGMKKLNAKRLEKMSSIAA